MFPCSMEKSLEIDRLGNELQSAHAVSKQSQEVRIISLVYSKGFLSEHLMQKFYYIEICNDANDVMSDFLTMLFMSMVCWLKTRSHHLHD